MPISCLALNKQESLSSAEIRVPFLIELVIVADHWEMYVPTALGAVPLRSTEEGERIRMAFKGDKLERADQEDMDPILRATISYAIRDDPRIGRVWMIQFTLFAALSAETQTFQDAPCCWDTVATIAQQQLGAIKEGSQDISMEQADLEGYGHHVLDDYQSQLRHLERAGWRRLETAKDIEHAVQRPSV